MMRLNAYRQYRMTFHKAPNGWSVKFIRHEITGGSLHVPAFTYPEYAVALEQARLLVDGYCKVVKKR